MIKCQCQSDLFYFTYRFFGSCLLYGNTLFMISFDNPLVLNASNTCSRYLYGFSLFIFANSIKLKYIVLALAPFFVFENKNFFLAITNINDNLNMYINDHLRMYTSDYALI